MKKKSAKSQKPVYPQMDHQAARMLGWVIPPEPPTKKQRKEIRDADQKFTDAIAEELRVRLIEER